MRFDRAFDPKRTDLNARRTRLIVTCLAVALAAPLAVAQQAKKPDFAAIRKTDLATIDRNNVDAWVKEQIQKIFQAQDDAAVKAQGQELQSSIAQNVKAADASPRFREGVAAILADAFVNLYPKAPQDRHPLACVYVLMALQAAGQPTPRAIEAYTLALSEPTAGGRMMGASGLLSARAQLTQQQWTTLLPLLQKVGSAESNDVTLARIYRLLALPANAPVDPVPVVTAILEARLGRIEQQNARPLAADAEALTWLGERTATMTNPQLQDRATLLIARMMTNATYAYTSKPLEEHKPALERVIRAAEAQLKTIVGRRAPSAKPGNITGAMLGPTTGQTDAMALELNKWIGTAQQPGALNGAPFNFEVGLKVPTPGGPATKPAPARPAK